MSSAWPSLANPYGLALDHSQLLSDALQAPTSTMDGLVFSARG
jgi:hypothetical protein